MVGQGPRGDLGKRDERHAPAHVAVLDEVLADLLVRDDDVEELPATCDLKCDGLVVVLLGKRDELRGDAVHLAPVEARRGVVVVEREPGNPRAHAIALLDKVM